ncbi:MAG: hypothetical protein K1Y02_26070, partial [Candidatus Hydrogenedentes bacterium]|nr:hypothetical protein [Candidatus Hydrogenedentota bacterium]
QRWLEDMQIVGGNPNTRARLRNASGYWPTLLYRLPPQCHEVGQLCEAIERYVSSGDHVDALRVEFGLDSVEARSALRLVNELQGEPLDVLESFASGDEYEGLRPEALRAWVEWAEMLQLIGASASGWKVDPVVSRLLA